MLKEALLAAVRTATPFASLLMKMKRLCTRIFRICSFLPCSLYTAALNAAYLCMRIFHSANLTAVIFQAAIFPKAIGKTPCFAAARAAVQISRRA